MPLKRSRCRSTAKLKTTHSFCARSALLSGQQLGLSTEILGSMACICSRPSPSVCSFGQELLTDAGQKRRRLTSFAAVIQMSGSVGMAVRALLSTLRALS